MADPGIPAGGQGATVSGYPPTLRQGELFDLGRLGRKRRPRSRQADLVRAKLAHVEQTLREWFGLDLDDLAGDRAAAIVKLRQHLAPPQASRSLARFWRRRRPGAAGARELPDADDHRA